MNTIYKSSGVIIHLMFFNKKILGEIGFYNLSGWWIDSFTKNERKIIEDIYKPLGYNINSKPLTKGVVHKKSQSKAFFLSILAGWFNNSKNRSIANRIIEQAGQCAEEDLTDVLSAHFVYSEMISIYYPQRENAKILSSVIGACRKQIEIALKVIVVLKQKYEKDQLENLKAAKDWRKDLKVWDGKEFIFQKNYDLNSEFNAFHLPGHKGYEQLAIILRNQGKNEEAIKLCEQAKLQGWSGDWSNRISRYSKIIF